MAERKGGVSFLAEHNVGASPETVTVVHLLHSVAYGGIETILINWLRALDPARIRVHVVVFANPAGTEQPFVHAAENAGLSVQGIPWSRRKPIFSSARRLVKILKEVRAHIVHTHNVYAEVVGYLAARKTGAKVLTTQYVFADFGWKRNMQQWVSARLIRRFDLVTSQCSQTMQEAIRRGVPADKQRVLISGIEPSEVRYSDVERAQRREAFGVSPEEFVLANVARLYPEKAQDLLLRAFGRIVRERPHARLWIYGIGPLESELRQLTRELDLEQTVRFMGFVPNLREVLPLMDLQIHSSHAEGVPLAICEGMVAGLPIVATAVGGIPEMLRHEQSGLLVQAGDEDALVRETIRLMDDASLHRRLGAEARRFIETDYALSDAVDTLAATYEELVA